MYESLMADIMPFPLRFTLKLHTKYQIFAMVPFQHREWHTVLPVETSIAARVFHNLLYIYGVGQRSFTYHI